MGSERESDVDSGPREHSEPERRTSVNAKERRTLPWPRPRSLRARLGLALALVVGITLVNIGFLSWGGSRRQQVFDELHRAIYRHTALNEARARLDEQWKQVGMLTGLLGGEGVDIGAEEERRIHDAIEEARDSLAVAFEGPADSTVLRMLVRIDSLASSWNRFYLNLRRDPRASRAEVELRAEPLAEILFGRDLPAAIRAQETRVQLANSAFSSGDRMWYRGVWSILATSAVLFAVLAWSTSRDLIRAINALKAGADRFGESELGHRVEVEDFDELAEVGARMNTMAHRLHRAHQELAVRNEELALLAFRDALTKLSNRALFRERVERALRGPDSVTRSVAVLFIDLDNFKAVNDTFGHNTGDRLLVEVAGRLLHTTRGCDTVARLGGDEFAILLDGDQGGEGVIVAERTMASLRKPFDVDGRTIHVGASIGLAWGEDSVGADELLRNADVAMYAAKADGKACYRVFAPAMHAALLDRAELETALRAALRKKEISLEFQPIVELATESIVGYEALARWRNPHRGNVEPSVFIPLAEECGLILPLGRWILHEACREAARWERVLPSVPITVSVNVSSRQLENPGFIGDLTEALENSGLDPQRLLLEITESVIMRDSGLNLDRLNEMKRLGIRLAIDDFGTGFSSLSYLQRFPVDVIKIDKAFVKSVAISSSDAALARTIIMLSETLRLKTVAEGIEYRDQQATLQALGCELGQGFLFAASLSAADVHASLRDHARVAKAMGNASGAGVPIGLVSPRPSSAIDIAATATKVHRA
jgi:diguanylate cyclase (GGDEF)-like protein